MGTESGADLRDELPTPRVLKRRWSIAHLARTVTAVVIGATLVVNA